MRSIVLVALAVPAGLPALADDASPIFSTGTTFAEQTGETLYAGICQACHMADAKGATGAGRYPALANNPKLEQSGYAVTMVLRGLNGMPAVGQMMSDTQVAQVVNYVRTHFGNDYPDPVKPADVKALR